MKRILCIFIAICFSASVMALSNMEKSAGAQPAISKLCTHKLWSKIRQHKCQSDRPGACCSGTEPVTANI